MKRENMIGLGVLGGFLAGSAAMYLLDPERGRRRRILMRNQLTHARRQMERFAGKAARDLSHRAQGAVAQVGAALVTEPLPDYVIEQRVRTAMGHYASHPGAIDVTSRAGRVELTGWIIPEEVGTLLRAVRQVDGVREVKSLLRVPEHWEHISSLQGGVPRTGMHFELWQRSWSPTARVLMGALAGAMSLYALRRRGLTGSVLALVGAGLLARSVSNRSLARVFGASREETAIRVQKTIHIATTPKELCDFWADPENYPQVMSHVDRVEKIGDNLYRWTVEGPAGTTLGWEGAITRLVPEKLVEWESTPGSLVGNHGVATFDLEPDGRTRLQIQMVYDPPAGLLGHFLAELFGVDPKHALDDDLVRLKSLFEGGRTRAHGQIMTLEKLLAKAAAVTGTAPAERKVAGS